jgi:hypothetical protein
MKAFILAHVMLFIVISSYAQDYSGTYTLTPSGQIILKLVKSDAGTYTGSLSGNNNVFKLSGQVQNGILKGRVGEAVGDNILFVAVMQNQVLTFTMADADLNGNLNPATTQRLTFVKSGETVAASAQNKSDVVINNIVLTRSQLLEIVKRYGVEPKPGNYWYDRVSGLYGVYGYPSFGFMYPGHNFGVLSRNASSGNTGVLINGRELPQLEWAVWSYILGSYIQPGSYWFDSQGNVGYTGNNFAVVNLFTAARKNGYAGKGNGGDNFWSSRFSSGNSNADNSQGYVSVPGYGPVGYGF